MYWSSPLGSGIAFWKRAKTSSTSALVSRRVFAGFVRGVDRRVAAFATVGVRRASGEAADNLAPAGRASPLLRNRPIPLYTQPP